MNARYVLSSGLRQSHLLLVESMGDAWSHLLKAGSTRFLEAMQCNKGHLSWPLVSLFLVCSDLG